MSTLRILDAAANRAREALRVLEDAARFCWDDRQTTESLKTLRHELAEALGQLPMGEALQQRDTEGDVGTGIKTEAEFTRTSLKEIVIANAKRLTEALRSLEEYAKLHSVAAAAQLETLRYRAYTLEQQLVSFVLSADAAERFRHVRLYVLLTESLCVLPWERTLEDILEAGREHIGNIGGTPMPRVCIQLREKNLESGELLRRARVVVAKCRAAGALAIINDRPDIALLSGADGVHVGQTDLAIADCRRVLGLEAIVGISTENLEQARAGVAAGASYIAVGPMFATTTKEKPRIAGPAYAAQAAKEILPPLVAIGGITLDNVGQITQAGVRCVAVSSAILRSNNTAAVTREFLNKLNTNEHK